MHWLPHFEFNEFHISFHNLGQIFRELRSHAREVFHVCMQQLQSDEYLGDVILDVLQAPYSTPKEALQLELGVLTVRTILTARGINYQHYLATSKGN